jgi:hypothetical protein
LKSASLPPDLLFEESSEYSFASSAKSSPFLSFATTSFASLSAFFSASFFSSSLAFLSYSGLIKI